MKKTLLIGLVVVITILSFTGLCTAGPEQLTINAKARSLGNAVTAYPPGLMSIHYNPAGLTLLEGKNASVGLSYVPVLKIRSEFPTDPDFPGFAFAEDAEDPIAGDSSTSTPYMVLPFGIGSEYGSWVVPAAGISYQAQGSRWTLAYGMYAPMGGGFDRTDHDDPARFGGESLYLSRFLYAAPAVAYKMTKTLSVGLSVGLGDASEGLDISLRVPNDFFAMTTVLAEISEDLDIPGLPNFGIILPPGPWFGGGIDPYEQIGSMKFDMSDSMTTSFNIGLLWEPVDWFSAGVVYQSESKAEMGGDYEIKYNESFQNLVGWFGESIILNIIAQALGIPTEPIPEQKGRVMVEYTFPQRAQFGVMLRPFNRLRLLCDLHWTDWSVWKKDKLKFDQDIQLLQLFTLLGYQGGRDMFVLERHARDTWHPSYGLEWQFLDRACLRLGYEPKKSMSPDRYFSLTMPMTKLYIYSAGLGIKITRSTSIDLAYTYMKSEKFKLKNNTSVNHNSLTSILYSPYAGLDYEQEITAQIYSLNLSYRW